MMRLVFNFYKNLLALSLAVGLLLSAATIASAQSVSPGEDHTGGWWMADQTQGDMALGDGDGYGLYLGSTSRYCGRPGAGYATMRSYIKSNYPDWVYWYVDETCSDGYVRICVEARSGNVACSTYADYGWNPL